LSTEEDAKAAATAGYDVGDRRLYWYSPKLGVDQRLQPFGTYLLNATLRPRFGFEVAGREHMRPGGGVLLVTNHLADVDMPFLAAAVVPRQLMYLSATKNFTNPAVGYLISALGAFPVHTERPDPSALRLARAHLEAGRTVAIFPEGYPTFGPKLAPFARGVGMLGLTPGIRIVPGALWGTHRVMKRGMPIGKGKVRVAFGPPISVPEAGSRRARADAVTEACETAVGEILGRLVAMDPDK
jgi:1-acyl-sn-glycerol-3-phosphate acyltransferase